MYVRIVTFRLDGQDPTTYRAHTEKVAPTFRDWAGLIRKIWLTDSPDGRHGGVYLFTDRAAADASRDTPVFRAVTANPHFADLRIEEFDVLDAPTAVTTAPAAA
jgi:quinol monooxygenase YgiN